MRRPGPREALWSGAALAAAGCAILAAAPAQYLGRQQDDLLYLIGAHSLLSGRFRLLSVPGEPPLYMIGPGLPALLAPLALFAGENWGVYQAFSALLLALAPALAFVWLRRRLDAATALLVCGVFALSPLTLSQSGTVMSEAPFLLCALGLLLALESGKAAASAALLLFSTQLRTAAWCLAPAVFASHSKRHWKERVWVYVPAAAGSILFALWSRAAAGSAQQKLEELAVAYAGGLGRLPAVAWENLIYYLSALGGAFLPASLAALAPAFGAVLLSVALKGAARMDRREPALWLLLAAAVLHLAWPWHYERYWIMPLPFFLWCLAEGLGRAAKPALAALLCCQLAFQSLPWLTRRQAWTAPELARTYAWIQERTAPESALASIMYVRDGFYAARPAVPLPPAEAPDAMRRTLKSRRVRFVLWQDGLDLGLSQEQGSPVRRALDRLDESLRDPAYFRLVYENTEEHARLYELL